MNLVLLILDPEFGDRLDNLPRPYPIWIVESERNRAVLENLPPAYGPLTVFPPRKDESATHIFERIVDSLDQHHNELAQDPPYDTLVVYGLPAEADMLDSLRDLGFVSQVKDSAAVRFLKAGAEGSVKSRI